MDNLTTEKSLRIISEAIERSKKSIAHNSGKPLILWGILVSVTAVAVYLLWQSTDNPAWNFLWLAMTAIGITGSYLLAKNNKAIPENEMSRILGNIWAWFGGFSIALYLMLLALSAICSGHGYYFGSINMTLIIAVILGFSGVLSGAVLRMNSIKISAAVATLAALPMALLIEGPAQILSFCVLGIFILIIPGIALQRMNSR